MENLTTSPKMSVETLKKMENDESVQSLAKSVFQAMAYEATVRSIVEPKQKEVIEFFKFKVSETLREKYRALKHELPEFVLSTKDLHLLDEEDFQIYLKEMHKFYTEQGFKVKFEYCPLLIAENLTRKAKAALVDVAEQYTGLSFDRLICSSLKNYHAYIEILLNLMSKKVGETLKTA